MKLKDGDIIIIGMDSLALHNNILKLYLVEKDKYGEFCLCDGKDTYYGFLWLVSKFIKIGEL